MKQESETNKIGVIHIYAQEMWHNDAIIVGNRRALTKLKELIEIALDTGAAFGEFMHQDGEHFDLHVVMDNSDWQSDSWKSRRLPYKRENK